jgi:LysM repeat protein
MGRILSFIFELKKKIFSLHLRKKKTSPLKVGCNAASDHSTHIVQYGETLKEIARSFGSPNERNIMACNDIQDPNAIFAGQVLQIPFHYYTVKKADTVYSIALTHQISQWDIWASRNGLFKKDNYKIEEGKKLKIWI